MLFVISLALQLVTQKLTGCSGKGHAVITHRQLVCFSRIREGYWSSTRAVHDSKQVDTNSDEGDMGGGFSRDPETEPRQEKTESKNRKGGEKQVSSSEGVDCVDGGQGKNEINGSEL